MSGNDFIVNYFKKFGIDDLKEYIRPSYLNINPPDSLKNINKACNLLKDNLNKNIFIQIDSDVDGYTSASMLYRFIKYINKEAKIDWRIHDGKEHGLKIDNLSGVEYDLIIIPDAGSDSYIEFKEIKENFNSEIIVLDHHDIGDNIENVCTLVNCNDGTYKNKNLCGAGVVQKFIERYCDMYSVEYDFDYDLLALGLISDMMSVIDLENRFYIKSGLSNIRHNLLKLTIDSLPYEFRLGNTVKNIGWYIAPRINAIVRFGKLEDKELLFKALITDDEDVCKESLIVNERNKNKQDRAVRKYFSMIENQLNYESVNLIDYSSLDIDKNVTGLLANKVSSETGKPCLFIKNNNGIYAGSCRGGNAKDFKSYLVGSNLFINCAGHSNALGISFKEENIDKIKKYFLKNKYEEFDNREDIEGVFNIKDIDIDFIKNVSNYCRLFGNNLPEPKFKIIIDNIYTKDIKKINDKSTIIFNLNGIKFIKKYCKKNEIDIIKNISRTTLQTSNKGVKLELLCTMTYDGVGNELEPCLKFSEYVSYDNKSIF